MSDTPPAATLRSPSPEVSATDERLKETSLAIRVMRRPELGAAAGLVLVIVFFLSTADPSMFTLAGVMNILVPGAQLRGVDLRDVEEHWPSPVVVNAVHDDR